MKWWEQPGVRQRLDEMFGLDLRSLALMRIGLGSILLWDLLTRAQDLVSHYSDEGVLPRGPLLERFSQSWALSLHFIGGEPEVQAALMIIAAGFALALVLGFRTRLCVAVSWLLLVSIQVRNPMLVQGGDIVLRLLLFWSLFLPLGARYSVDAAMDTSRGGSDRRARILHAGSVALLAQIAFIYQFSALLKSPEAWWRRGDAVYYAMHLDRLVTPLGSLLLPYPELMQLLTRATYLLEGVFPLFLLFPFAVTRVRVFLVVSFVSFHVGLALTMKLGPFPAACAAAWMAVIPTGAWDFLQRKLTQRQLAGVRLFYDGECNVCHKISALISTFALLPNPVEAQRDRHAHQHMRAQDSWVFRDADGKMHTGFQAMIQLSMVSPLLAWLAPVITLAPVARLGEVLYRTIARRRERLARLLALVEFRPLNLRPSLTAQMVAALILLYVLAWNLRTLDESRYQQVLPARFDFVGFLLHVEQRWDMFAPSPTTEDGWFVITGELADGSSVDLLLGTEAGGRADAISASYPSYRWSKYMRNLWLQRNAPFRRYYGRYLCRQWNAENEGSRTLRGLEITFMREDTLADYEPSNPTRVSLWKQDCFDEMKARIRGG